VQNFREMFHGTNMNYPLNKWNTSSATNMDLMFMSAHRFNQDISMWCVPHIFEKPSDFDNGTNSNFANHPELQPQWGSCPPTILTNPVIK